MALRRGVTLVEVIVVVSIVIVLASVLMVVLFKGKDRGKIAVCISNLKQIDLAYRLYAEDHDDCSPISPTGNLGDYGAWKNALSPYVRSNEIYYCPSDKNAHIDRPGGDYAVDRSFYTSYNGEVWGPGSVMGEKPGYYFKVLSAIPDPAGSVHMYDYTITDRSRCYEDEESAYYLNYSPHAEMYSVLYWDGHVKHEPNKWYWFVNRIESRTCP